MWIKAFMSLIFKNLAGDKILTELTKLGGKSRMQGGIRVIFGTGLFLGAAFLAPLIQKIRLKIHNFFMRKKKQCTTQEDKSNDKELEKDSPKDN